MIPKKIWQTYKTNFSDLPEYASAAANTWIDKNPDWEYHYLSDNDVMDFVRDNFDSEWLKIFSDKCPVGVMRADLWRVMTIYINGGMYADLDTICNYPIDTWLNNISDKRVIINAEHEVHIQQWAFLSEPEHPVFGFMLEKMKEGFINPDFTNPHFVHALTGPAIFTRSILEYMQLWSNAESIDGEIFKLDHSAQTNLHELNLVRSHENFNQSPSARHNGIYLVPSHRFFHNEVVSHLYGSQNWNDGNYVQWIFEREGLADGK